jgi:arsenate reductase
MTTHVLILCTHNSARSVLGEGMLNHWAKKLGSDVQAHSAGSAPSGRINPFALEALSQAGVDTAGCYSKSWDAFSQAVGNRMLQLLQPPLETMSKAERQQALAEIAKA